MCQRALLSKNKTIEEDKIFEHDVSDKGLVFRMYKESLQVNNKMTNKPIKKLGKVFEYIFLQMYKWSIST